MTTPLENPHVHWDELAAGHALDALEPAEESEFLGHLVSCPQCRTALNDHEFVAAQVGALAEATDVEPPSWDRIRAGVVGDRIVVLPARRERRLARHASWLAAAAAAVVVAGAGVATWQLSHNGSPSVRDAAVGECRSTPSCHVVPLQAASRERAVVIVENGAARIVPTSLDAPPAGEVYALWQLPRDGRPVLLAEPSSNKTSAASTLALPYDETAAFAVSLEPASVVPSSPTHVVAVGRTVA